MRPNRRRFSCLYGRFLSPEAVLEVVNSYKRYRLCNSFRAVADEIAEGISASQYTAANRHWTKLAELFQDVSLNPLLVSYQDPVFILNTFARQYQTRALTPSGHQV